MTTSNIENQELEIIEDAYSTVRLKTPNKKKGDEFIDNVKKNNPDCKFTFNMLFNYIPNPAFIIP